MALHHRRRYHQDGASVLERWLIPGLAHGTPIAADPADADRGVGTPGPYMLSAGISSTWHLARAWGLLTQASHSRTTPPRHVPRPAPPSSKKPCAPPA